MSQSLPQPTGEPEGKPGKIRTWWHPLLANMLRWQLGSHYEVREEVPVGKKPLQIDLLLLHREQGELPTTVRRILAGLVEYLGELTLVEFKARPTPCAPATSRPSCPTPCSTAPKTTRSWHPIGCTCSSWLPD